MLSTLWSELQLLRSRAIVRRPEVERELDDELRFHLEREAVEVRGRRRRDGRRCAASRPTRLRGHEPDQG